MPEDVLKAVQSRLDAAFPDATKTRASYVDWGSQIGLAVQFGESPNMKRFAVRFPIVEPEKAEAALKALREYANNQK